jgi:hypothetical protein
MNLEVQFQRDLNRCIDSDRNTKKKGLQKLFESLPWNDKKVKADVLVTYLLDHVFKVILDNNLISDPVEKCREYTFKIIQSTANLWKGHTNMNYELFLHLSNQLCNRVNELPFPENAEELRFLISEILLKFIEKDFELKQASAMHSMIKDTENDQTDRSLLPSLPLDTRFQEKLFFILTKLLQDNFPSVKRSCAEIIISLCTYYPQVMKSHVKMLLKGLEANALHQHSKTRTITLTALGRCLSCLSGEAYERVLNDSVYALFHKSLNDRTSSVKLEFCEILSQILVTRFQSAMEHTTPLVTNDLQLFLLLLILAGDGVEEIALKGKQCIEKIVSFYYEDKIPLQTGNQVVDEDIVDGEYTLREHQKALKIEEIALDESINSEKAPKETEIVPQFVTPQLIKRFFTNYLPVFLPFLLQGINDWTNESKMMYINSLKVLIIYLQNEISSKKTNLFSILLSLSSVIRDEDHEVRRIAEGCLLELGHYGDLTFIVDILLPSLLGQQPTKLFTAETEVLLTNSEKKVKETELMMTTAGESIPQKSGLLLIFAQIMKGYSLGLRSNSNSSQTTSSITQVLENVFFQLIFTGNLLTYREVYFREGFLLFLRSFLESFPQEISSSSFLQFSLSLLLVYMKTHCYNEQDTIPQTARRELVKLSFLILKKPSIGMIENNKNWTTLLPKAMEEKEEDFLINEFLCNSYSFMLSQVLFPNELKAVILNHFASSNHSMSTFAKDMNHLLQENLLTKRHIPSWIHSSIQKSVFECLMNSCPQKSWEFFALLAPIFLKYTKPKESVPSDSMEAHMQSYASQRGEELIPTTIEEIDIRLNFMILIENLIRYLTHGHWELSKFFLSNCEMIMKEIILPNLVWRVGRVEGTIRKLTLTVCYHMMKLGSIPVEVLSKFASELLPLLIGHIDDNESSIRFIIVLTITILFDRLPGCYSDEIVNVLYPKIIARLDDNNDEIRLAIISTLDKFFHCAVSPRSAYHSTMLEYVITQLFIHLDDSNEAIQEAIYQLLSMLAANKEMKSKDCAKLILEKCETNRLAHRTPKYCDKLIFEIKGIEIIEE